MIVSQMTFVNGKTPISTKWIFIIKKKKIKKK